jgi:hypothetical protein
MNDEALRRIKENGKDVSPAFLASHIACHLWFVSPLFLHGQKQLQEETPQRVLLAKTVPVAAAEQAAEEMLEVVPGETADQVPAALLVASKGTPTSAQLAQAGVNGFTYWAR